MCQMIMCETSLLGNNSVIDAFSSSGSGHIMDNLKVRRVNEHSVARYMRIRRFKGSYFIWQEELNFLFNISKASVEVSKTFPCNPFFGTWSWGESTVLEALSSFFPNNTFLSCFPLLQLLPPPIHSTLCSFTLSKTKIPQKANKQNTNKTKNDKKKRHTHKNKHIKQIR